MWRWLGLAMAGCFAAPVAPAAPPTAEAIINATIARYATARSYEDHGTITTAFDAASMITTDEKTFDIAFVRDERFRFDVRADGSPYTVWNDGVHTYSRWRHSAKPGVHMEADVVTALREAASISDGVSVEIPSVLWRGEVAAAWLSALRLRVDGAESIDGAPCWRLTGVNPHHEDVTLWIDQRTHALRRTLDHHRTKSFEAMVSTTFAPIIDQPVDAAKLATPLPDGPELPWIGVVFEPASTRIAQVIENTPAARAKLVAGDRITELDHDALRDLPDLVTRIRQSRLGARLLLTVEHGGTTRSVVVVTENQPYLEQIARERLLDRPAPDFALDIIAGPGPASRAELAGKVVVLAFGSAQCQSCSAAFDQLAIWQTRYGPRGLRIILVSADFQDAVVARIRAGVTLTAAQDPGDKLAIAYLRTELPALVVIDKRGIVRRLDTYAETADVETAIEQMLK
jgi:peroxiredoxin